MRLARLLTIRSIKKRTSRTILTLFGILLGVSALFAINHVNEKAFSSLTSFFEGTSGKVHLEIKNEALGETVPVEVLEKAKEVEGVETLVPVVEAAALLKEEKEEEENPLSMGVLGQGQNGITLYGVDLQLEKTVRDYTLAEGSYFREDSDLSEILLVQDYAKEKGLNLGEKIKVQTSSGVLEVKIVGLLKKEGAGFLQLGKAGFLPLEGLQKHLEMEESVTRLDVRVKGESEDPKRVEDVEYALQEVLGEGYQVSPPSAQSGDTSGMLSGYQISLNFMAGIALFVGAFLIYNAFSMTVTERKRELGILRCVGLTRGQTALRILEEGILLGLFGAFLGILLGILLSDGLSYFMERFLGQPVERGGYSIALILRSMGIGVFVTLLSAVLPALQAGKVSPLEALRVHTQRKEGRLERYLWVPGLLLLLVSAGILLANPFSYDVQFRLGSLTVFSLFVGATLLIPGTIKFWQRLLKGFFRMLFGDMGELGSRNIMRAKNRTMLTVAALMVGVSMIVSTEGITGSFRKDLSVWMDSYLGGDVFISAALPVELSLREEIEDQEETLYVSPSVMETAYWEKGEETDESVTLLGIDPKTYGEVTSYVFSEENVEEEAVLQRFAMGRKIFISEASAAKLNLTVGDEMVLKTLEGPVSFEIIGVLLDYSSQGTLLTATLDDLQQYFGADKASGFSIRLKEGEDATAYVEKLRDLFEEDYELLIESNKELRIQAENLMAQAFSMFDVLGLLSVVVAALGVLNTLTMSVLERTREIGMLRSMGMTRAQVVKMVLSEAGLLGIIGGILGLFLGLLLSYILISAMGIMSGYQLEFVLPRSAIYTSILVAFVTSLLAAVFPARKAARIPVLSAIQYE